MLKQLKTAALLIALSASTALAGGHGGQVGGQGLGGKDLKQTDRGPQALFLPYLLPTEIELRLNLPPNDIK